MHTALCSSAVQTYIPYLDYNLHSLHAKAQGPSRYHKVHWHDIGISESYDGHIRYSVICRQNKMHAAMDMDRYPIFPHEAGVSLTIYIPTVPTAKKPL